MNTGRQRCPKLKPVVPGTSRSYTGTANGVRYAMWYDILEGRWNAHATIGTAKHNLRTSQKHVTRPLPGGPWSTKSDARRAICNHARFYRKHFR